MCVGPANFDVTGPAHDTIILDGNSEIDAHKSDFFLRKDLVPSCVDNMFYVTI